MPADELERARVRVAERTPLESFDASAPLAFGELDAFRASAESAVSASRLVDQIDAAKEVVRSGAFYDPDLYIPATRTLYHGLRLFSSAWHPTRLTPHNFTMGYANDRSSEVLAAVQDEDQNPFLSYFRAELLPRLMARKPRVVGMSVIYGSQLIPALTLGRLIKQALPECHVTAGGGFLAYIGEKLMGAQGMDACLDSIIFHEGEDPTLELCRALCAGTTLEGVGGLMWFDRRGEDVSAVNNGLAHPIRLDEAPCPDFDGLPLDKYFSPEVVIPYDINRGCYYGECTFCTLPTVIGPGYRTRTAETIFMPLTVGGGVRSLQDIRDLLNAGADKVSIMTAAVENPELVSEAAELIGSANLVVAIDARRVVEDGSRQDESTDDETELRWEVCTHGGRRSTGIDAVAWAERMAAAGAGEILLTSMDRDGTRSGYDLPLLRATADRIPIPVIASGGGGSAEDLAAALQDGPDGGHAQAALAASIFHFQETTVMEVKRQLREWGIAVREPAS